jgi:hypothetical protein
MLSDMESQGSGEPLSLPDILKQGEEFRDAYSQITRRWKTTKFLKDVFNKAKITIFLKAEIFNGLQNVNKIVFGWANEEKTISVPSSAVQSNIIYLIVLATLKVKYDRLRNCSTTGLLCNKDIEVLEKVLIKKTHRINLLKYPLKNIYTPWNEFGKNRKLTRAPSLNSLKKSYFQPTKCPKDAFLCYVKTTTPNQTLCLFNVHPENISLYSPYGDTQMNIPAIQSAINPFFDELCLKAYATSDKSSIKTAQSAEEEYKKGLLRKYRTDIPTTSLEKYTEAFIQVVKKSIATSLKTESIKKSSELASWEITNVLKERDKGELDLLKPGGPSWEDFIRSDSYIYERPEVYQVINLLKKGVTKCLIEGDAASGKSTILKNIGVTLRKNKTVYYVNLKTGIFPDVKLLDKLTEDNYLLIDDLHLNRTYVESILQNSNITCKIILSSRPIQISIFSEKYPRLLELSDRKVIVKSSHETMGNIIKKAYGKNIASRTTTIDRGNVVSALNTEIAKLTNNLVKSTNDLWLLIFAIAAKENTHKLTIEQLIKSYFFDRLMSDYNISAPAKIILPLAVFSFFEIPMRQDFLIERLKVSPNEIDILAKTQEILLHNGYISLHHRSIAGAILFSSRSSIFKDELHDLFRCCACKQGNEKLVHIIFSEYLSHYPSDFWNIFRKIIDEGLSEASVSNEVSRDVYEYFLLYKKNDITMNLRTETSLTNLFQISYNLSYVCEDKELSEAVKKNTKSLINAFEKMPLLIKGRPLDFDVLLLLSYIFRIGLPKNYAKILNCVADKINTGDIIYNINISGISSDECTVGIAQFFMALAKWNSSKIIRAFISKLNNKSIVTIIMSNEYQPPHDFFTIVSNLMEIDKTKARVIIHQIPIEWLRMAYKGQFMFFGPTKIVVPIFFDNIKIAYALDPDILKDVFNNLDDQSRKHVFTMLNTSMVEFRKYPKMFEKENLSIAKKVMHLMKHKSL